MFKEILQYKSVCLLWSGGLDSTLILSLLRHAGVPVDIVTFGREYLSKKQKARMDALIQKWDLKVFTYPSSRTFFMGDGDNISAVFDYAIGDAVVPNIRDVIEGDKCIADLQGMQLQHSPIKWDCVLTGIRADDEHYATAGLDKVREWRVGDTTFINVLHDWTREEVKAALKSQGLPYTEVEEDEDSGNLALCQKCLRAIEPVECPKDGSIIEPAGKNLQLNLVEFRKRFTVF